MDWIDDLDTYELTSITLIIIGSMLFLLKGLVYTGGYYQYEIVRVLNLRDLGELLILTSAIGYLASLIFGTGIFLSLRMINKKFEIHEHFKYLNYSYLALLLPNIIFSIDMFLNSIDFFHSKGLNIQSDFINHLLRISRTLFPGVRYVLLAIMLIWILLEILGNKNGSITLSEKLEKDE